ncbi:hypothetical protein HA402_009696 [Bradysia odoriphaga]|nr:hypothetical protein HA402_009696 [Bradysia odoriphaga]
MEKPEHQRDLNTPIHPTLAVYLSGNFSEQPSSSTNTNSSDATARPIRWAYLENLSKNKSQFGSVAGGYLQLLVSGSHIAWGIWRFDFNEPWFRSTNGTFIFILMSFYVAAIIGGIISGLVSNIWRKQTIYCLSGSTMVSSSLISVIWCSEEMGILFARMLAGLAHGLVYNVLIIHAGENAKKEMRGIITSTINCCLWLSIFIGSLLIATVQMGITTSISSDRMIGISSFVWSVLSLMYTIFWTEESMVYLLNRNKLGEALEVLSKLRNEPETSGRIADDFEEMRLMVNRDKIENQNILRHNNDKPLILMFALKFLYVLTNNFLFNWIFMLIVTRLLPTGSKRLSPVILTAVRFIGSVLQTLLGDTFGRKTFLSVSCTLSGITLLILEIMLITITDHTIILHWVTPILCIVFQFFVALGIDPMHNVMLSEAFGTSKKNWSVVFVNGCENAAQMLFIGVGFVDGIFVDTTYLYIHLALFISVSIILILVVLLFFHLPETKGLSLSETRNLFRNVTAKCMTR